MLVVWWRDICVQGSVPVVETDWDRYEGGENSTWEGPGHGSVVVDGEGDWWLVYHSWRYGHLMRDRVPPVNRSFLCMETTQLP